MSADCLPDELCEAIATSSLALDVASCVYFPSAKYFRCSLQQQDDPDARVVAAQRLARFVDESNNAALPRCLFFDEDRGVFKCCYSVAHTATDGWYRGKIVEMHASSRWLPCSNTVAPPQRSPHPAQVMGRSTSGLCLSTNPPTVWFRCTNEYVARYPATGSIVFGSFLNCFAAQLAVDMERWNQQEGNSPCLW